MSLSGGYLLSFSVGVGVFVALAMFLIGREINEFVSMDSEDQKQHLGRRSRLGYYVMNVVSFDVIVLIPTAVWYCIIYALQAVAIVHSLPSCK